MVFLRSDVRKGGRKKRIRNRRTGFLVKSDEECLEILLNREYRYIEKDALRDFSASFLIKYKRLKV